MKKEKLLAILASLVIAIGCAGPGITLPPALESIPEVLPETNESQTTTTTPSAPAPPQPQPPPTPAPSPDLPDKNGESGDVDALNWIDAMGMISIPDILSYEEVGLHGELIIYGDILESKIEVWGDTWMYVGPLMGDYEPLVAGAEKFVFDDGHIGIFTGAFDLDSMTWIREDGMLITLRHGGDMSIFTDNEELILKIVRSLR